MSLGSLFEQSKLQKYENNSISHATGTEATAAMEGTFLVIAFIHGADHQRFSGLWQDLKNNMILGQDTYPQTLPTAYDVLQNYKLSSNSRPSSNNDVRVSFLQVGSDENRETNPDYIPMEDYSNHVCRDGQAPVPGYNGLCFPNLKCFECNQYGHIAHYCPTSNGRNIQNL